MTNEHDFPVQLIAPYARGELSPEESGFVAAHLAVCEDCRAELRGVEALVGAAPPDALGDLERAALHRAVLAETRGERAVPARRGLGERIAPALGAAALLAVLVVGAVQLSSGLGGGDDAGDAGSGQALEADIEDLAGEPLGLAPAPGVSRGSVSDGAAATEEGAVAGGGSEGREDTASTTSTFSDPPPEELAFNGSPAPYFEPGQRVLSEEALRVLGSSRDPFDGYSRAYGAASVTDRERSSRIQALADASFDPQVVEDCSRAPLAGDPNALPAYGAIGTFDDREVLVLGFATAPSGALDRYDLWVWPLGDCSSPLARFRGPI